MIENHMILPYADDDADEYIACGIHQTMFHAGDGCEFCAEDREWEQFQEDRKREVADETLAELVRITRALG